MTAEAVYAPVCHHGSEEQMLTQSNKLPSGGLAKQGARLVRNCHEKSASTHVDGLQCSYDRDIERDHPQGTGLTGDAAPADRPGSRP
jgi:hypothetical protein